MKILLQSKEIKRFIGCETAKRLFGIRDIECCWSCHRDQEDLDWTGVGYSMIEIYTDKYEIMVCCSVQKVLIEKVFPKLNIKWSYL